MSRRSAAYRQLVEDVARVHGAAPGSSEPLPSEVMRTWAVAHGLADLMNSRASSRCSACARPSVTRRCPRCCGAASPESQPATQPGAFLFKIVAASRTMSSRIFPAGLMSWMSPTASPTMGLTMLVSPLAAASA